MTNYYQKDARSASIEKLFTEDYMVTFNDDEVHTNQFETFHSEQKAIDAAERWILKQYEPI